MDHSKSPPTPLDDGTDPNVTWRASNQTADSATAPGLAAIFAPAPMRSPPFDATAGTDQLPPLPRTLPPILQDRTTTYGRSTGDRPPTVSRTTTASAAILQPDLSEAGAPSHRRNVSWGRNLTKPTLQRDSSDGKPILRNGPLSPRDSSSRRVLTTQASRARLSSADINDLLGVKPSPVEVEAEAYIREALEQQQQQQQQQHAMEEVSPTHRNVMSSASIPREVMRQEEEKADVSETLVDSPPSSAAPPPSIPRPAMVKRQASTRPPIHRRSETMEQRLMGLTSALGALQAEDFAVNESTPLRARTNTAGTVHAPDHEHILTTGDALAQNASLLFRRTPKSTEHVVVPTSSASLGLSDDEESQVSSLAMGTDGSSGGQSAAQRWRKLKNVTMAGGHLHPKKTDEAIAEEELSEDGGEVETTAIANGNGAPLSKPPSERYNDKPDKPKRQCCSCLKRDWKVVDEFGDFVSPMAGSIRLFFKIVVLYVMVPATGVAAILFYLAGNPPVGILPLNATEPVDGVLINTEGRKIDPNQASASWWLLFVFVRQLITFTMAKATEVFLIDFLSIHTGVAFQLLGPWPTLFLMGSRGWPCILFFWGIYDFALLAGDGSTPFFSHWLWWQRLIKLMNQANPSGNIIGSIWNHRILAIAVCISFVVACKRFLLGLYLGKKTFATFSDPLASVMKKILLVSQVAALGRDILKEELRSRTGRRATARQASILDGKLEGLFLDADADDDSNSGSMNASFSQRSVTQTDVGVDYGGMTPVIDPNDRHPLTDSLSSQQKSRMEQILGAWEEPKISDGKQEWISVNSLLQFRRALACLRTDFPFGRGSFGIAGSREECVSSAQEVFRRLMLRSVDEEYLDFEVLASLGVLPDGSLDQQKLIDLVKLFRPNRDGKLAMVDFVKSVDVVYREIRQLRASVDNSSKIDKSFENILNVLFYAAVITATLSAIGLDPLALFLSISGVVLAFAFMIGPASSKYFEGLLFVLVRRPYGIGDCIHVSSINENTDSTGSGWWLVEDVNLFTTSVMYIYTQERATMSNGSLANSRIINSSRSSAANLFVLIKFPIDVPYEKLVLFQQSVELYVRNHPREWKTFLAFRATRVEAAQGFVEYSVLSRHRETWSSWSVLKDSQARLSTFCLELTKKLDINYKSPPLPVDLAMQSKGASILMGPGHPSPELNATESKPSPDFNLTYSPDLRGLQERFAPATETRKKST